MVPAKALAEFVLKQSHRRVRLWPGDRARSISSFLASRKAHRPEPFVILRSRTQDADSSSIIDDGRPAESVHRHAAAISPSHRDNRKGT
jgi:hypothetical protein